MVKSLFYLRIVLALDSHGSWDYHIKTFQPFERFLTYLCMKIGKMYKPYLFLDETSWAINSKKDIESLEHKKSSS